MTTLRGNAIGLAMFLAAFGMTPASSSVAADVTQPPCKTDVVRSTYLLGADDQLQISGPEPDEAAGPPKIVGVDGQGDIQVALVGRVHVAGLTVQQAEQEVNKKLAVYVKKPQATIDVKELRSQPASVLGAVNQPGVHQVAGHKTLLEMISLAGGVRPDAGYSIRITRQVEWGCIPLPGATLDASGQFSVAQVKLQDIMEAKVPEENIQIFPHDVISVPKAELIYVTGDVKKSGGFILGEKQNMSVLQAISMAEGLGQAPDTKHAKILRMTPGADKRTEIPVDLKTILAGKGQDVPLQGNDILFVPDSTGKKIAIRALEAAITTGTGVAIYRP
jgi:polysaccharide export outer membrane protein